MTQSASHLREVPFDPALHDFEMANDGADWAIFSRDRTRRYALGRGLYPGLFHARRHVDAPTAIVVGLNPSKAGVDDDQTITKEIGFASRLGCARLVKFNLFGHIETHSERLPGAPRPIGGANDDVIRRELAKLEPTRIIVLAASPKKASADAKRSPFCLDCGHPLTEADHHAPVCPYCGCA